MFGLYKKKIKTYRLEDLAAEAIMILSERYPDDSFKYDKNNNIVEDKDDDGVKFFLGNIYKSIKDLTEEDRRSYLLSFFNSLDQKDNKLSMDVLSSSLLTRARTQAEVGNRTLHLTPDISENQYFTVTNGDICFDLVIDRDNVISTPQRDNLLIADLDENAILSLALSNLKSTSQGNMWNAISKNVWMSIYQDDYDAARLISLFPDIDLPFEGAPIAYMPSHSVCLITNSLDKEIIEFMIQHGQEASQAHRPLSQAIWTYQNGGWYRLSVERDHAASNVINKNNYQDIASGYAEQASLLEQHYEETGIDIFVASQLLYVDENDGTVFSLAVMTFGVDTLLPKVDRVGCVDPRLPEDQQYLGMMPWNDFIQLAGSKGIKLYDKLVPVRYDALNGLSVSHRRKIRGYFSNESC